jgi:hypothetical protein
LASQSRAVSREEVQTALSRVLLDRIRRDPYPSYTQMSLLEQTLPRSLQRAYLNILLEKVITDDRPSTTMIRRIQRIAERL